MLNAIGLQGIGVHRFVRERLPELRERRAVVIVNVCGVTLDEYVEVARILSDAEGVAAIELNISCPNIKEGGIQFGCSLHGTFDVVSAVRKATRLPLIPKLTPNVTSVVGVRPRGGGRRRRRRLAGEHVPRDGHRRRDAASRAEQRDGRPERAGHPADCGAHGVRVPRAGAGSRSSAWAGSPTRATRSSSSSRARAPSRSAPPTSSIRSSGRSCSTGSRTTARATGSSASPTSWAPRTRSRWTG